MEKAASALVMAFRGHGRLGYGHLDEHAERAALKYARAHRRRPRSRSLGRTRGVPLSARARPTREPAAVSARGAARKGCTSARWSSRFAAPRTRRRLAGVAVAAADPPRQKSPAPTSGAPCSTSTMRRARRNVRLVVGTDGSLRMSARVDDPVAERQFATDVRGLAGHRCHHGRRAPFSAAGPSARLRRARRHVVLHTDQPVLGRAMRASAVRARAAQATRPARPQLPRAVVPLVITRARHTVE